MTERSQHTRHFEPKPLNHVHVYNVYLLISLRAGGGVATVPVTRAILESPRASNFSRRAAALALRSSAVSAISLFLFFYFLAGKVCSRKGNFSLRPPWQRKILGGNFAPCLLAIYSYSTQFLIKNN